MLNYSTYFLQGSRNVNSISIIQTNYHVFTLYILLDFDHIYNISFILTSYFFVNLLLKVKLTCLPLELH